MTNTLHFKGDLRNRGAHFGSGPSLDGRRFRAEQITYDEASDVSTVEYRDLTDFEVQP